MYCEGSDPSIDNGIGSLRSLVMRIEWLRCHEELRRDLHLLDGDLVVYGIDYMVDGGGGRCIYLGTYIICVI